MFDSRHHRGGTGHDRFLWRIRTDQRVSHRHVISAGSFFPASRRGIPLLPPGANITTIEDKIPISSERNYVLARYELSCMNNAAILVGNTQYDSLSELPCCHDDLLAMKELLEATERYSDIEVVENTNAHDLKAQMRAAIDRQSSVSELFLCFTGHGYQQDDEFYYCATEFDSNRPNATGISTKELHELLSMARATVVVKVIDACNSGTVLVKSGQGFVLEKEPRLRSLIQISSCLDSQNSLAGQPLIVFTEKFRD